MSDIEGVNVKTAVDISWYSLGVNTLADEPDHEQAALLQGFGTGLLRLTTLQSEMQLQHIANKVLENGTAYNDLTWLIDGLHERLHQEETK